ncbi:acetyltransferase [Amylocarpus encephaloides]|uniref:Acetyltransferase n=1 Tax=Amylocarpus encephaloides TaxID=45428 RepID=A0A9P8C732_9HELO|nr:acetyltransferase [Amylocarpus encephaloides]
MPPSTTPTPPPSSLPRSSNPKLPTSIRNAAPWDASQIAHLGASTFTHTFGDSLPPADLEAYLNTSYAVPSILSEITSPAMTTLVATSPAAPDNILGFTQLNTTSKEPCIEHLPAPVELQRLYVAIDAAGQGIGRKLVEEAEHVARGLGKEALWLGVWEGNSKGQGIYKRLGFEYIGHHDFVMGECVQRDWIMWKKL